MEQPRGDLRALTGLRFVAAFGVVLAHLPGVALDPWLAPAARFFAEGAAGVPFFFVLSGFVLTYANRARFSGPGHGPVRSYLIARVARIYPLHLLTLGLALWLPFVAAPSVGGPAQEAGRIAANALLVQGFTPNVAYIAVYNAPAWTLSCEMFFYLVLPLLLLGTVGWANRPRFWAAIAIVGAILPLALMRLAVRHPAVVDSLWPLYLRPMIHLGTFLVGVALGHLFLFRRQTAGRRSIWAATALEVIVLVMLAGLIALAPRVNLAYRQYGWYVPVMAGVVWLFSQERGVLSRLAASRPIVYLGEISFSVYMLHCLVISRSWIILHDYLRPAWIAALSIGITIAASAACHRWFESPMRRYLVNRLSGRRIDPAAKPLRRAA